MKTSLLLLTIVAAIGCAGRAPEPAAQYAEPPTIVREIEIDAQENAVPGTVEDVWEEPMYDVVEAPGQLDPTATYYRARHRSVIEVRPGRHEPLNYPQ